MMNTKRARLNVEALECRTMPSAVTQSFNATSSAALPSGWTQWSNDGSTVFATNPGVGVSGSAALVSNSGSATSGLAWETQVEPGDTGVSADVNLNSLVPTLVFADGANLGTASPTYLAAEIQRGVSVSLLQVRSGASTVLATVSSPASSYFSGNWAQVSLVPADASIGVRVERLDTGMYLNAQGTWQAAATNAIAVNNSLAESAGCSGVGRLARYAGAVDLDDFTVTPPPASPPPSPPASPLPSPPASPPSPPTPNQPFDAASVGSLPSGWQNWNSDASGSAGVSTGLAISPPNAFSFSGDSALNARAWYAATLPAAVSASTDVYLNSLIPAELFVDGSNLSSSSPTYDAVTLTRGMQANLVQVVNGNTTILATLSSSGYVSNQWVQVELTAQGSTLQASIYCTTTGQWLTSSGAWSENPSIAFSVTNAASLPAGNAGIGRLPTYSGSVTFDNFNAGAAGTVGPAVSASSSAGWGSVSGTVTFQASATGTVSQMVFALNGAVQATSVSSTASWTLDTTSLANGTYTLTVLAGAPDGTVGAATETFTVANLPPPPPPPVVTIPAGLTITADPSTGSGYAPVPTTDTLFGPGGPSYLDVDQGEEGDCWLIAGLAEVAEQAPQDIVSMFKYDGNTVENGSTVGVYTVRFFNSAGAARYVTIDDELPGGGSVYDHPVNGVLWVALAEKAYAAANGLGYVSSFVAKASSYDALNSGFADWAIQAITDVGSTEVSINPAQAAAAYEAGQFVVLSSQTPASSAIVANHSYAVVGYNPSTGNFLLMNPWGGSTTTNLSPQGNGAYGLFSASTAFVEQNFTMQYING